MTTLDDFNIEEITAKEQQRRKDREYARKYYHEHSENAIESVKKWQRKHPEQIYESQRRYRQEHHENYTKYSQNWEQIHPDSVNATQKGRRKTIKDNNALLKINGCAICGYDTCPSALHFHHANPEDKKLSIAMKIRWCAGYITDETLDELNKCILLCSNCHAEIHELEQVNRSTNKF